MNIQIGTAYYPEDWDEERVRYDARLMQDAGVTLVRMAEFAWSHLEITEGNYDFQWLHKAVEIFGQHGIRTVMCTPSSAAPAWMCRHYPDILRQQRNGDRAWFGVRDHTCYTSSTYRHFITRMATKMAEEFKDNPWIYAWQIDNEPGCSRFPDCFCPECQQAFRNYLQRKYGSLQQLNQAWGTTFWSGEYRDWREIEPENRYENMGSCRVLDTKIFRSDVQTDFIMCQADAIRHIIPNARIGTNNFVLADRYKGFQNLDFAGNDLYPSTPSAYHETAFQSDIYRDAKSTASPWILETRVRGGWPRYDFDKLFFWLYAGHGNDHVFYFHWNSHTAGNEKDHTTIISTSGKPGPKYRQFKHMIQETKLIPDTSLPQPKAECAMILDYEEAWIYGLGFQDRADFYETQLQSCYDAMRRNGDDVAVISPNHDFKNFRLLALPILPYISDKLAQKLKEYVQRGGILLMNGRSGLFDEFGKNLIQEGPDKVADLFGITIGENQVVLPTNQCHRPFQIPDYQPSDDFARYHTIVQGILDGQDTRGTLNVWTAHLQAAPDTKVLMTFGESELQGEPFLTCHSYGQGKALYYAADAINKELQETIMRYAKKLAHLNNPDLPRNVDMTRRGNYLFLCNFNFTPVEVRLPYPGTQAILGPQPVQDTIRLDKLGVAVLNI